MNQRKLGWIAVFDNSSSLTLVNSFPPDTSAGLKALELAHEFALAAGLGGEQATRLTILLEELVTNIVEHGVPPDDSEILISLTLTGEGIGMTLRDAGTHFDPRTAALPTGAVPEHGGGAGLALVRAWSRILSYERADGLNVLCLLVPDHV